MSLADRVNRASKAQVNENSEAVLFSTLRTRVSDALPDNVLASFSAGETMRAENEVKSLSQTVFEEKDWNDVSADQKAKLVDKLLESIFGFGPLSDLLADEEITEVMVNGPSAIYYERAGKLYKSDERFVDAEQLSFLIDRIVSPLGRRIDESSPMVNARLPQGYRVNAIIPPIALHGPVLTIRKFSEHVITLDEMRESGTVDQGLQQFLIWAVRARKNIAISGGTGSGKTTMLNALAACISPDERLIVIEDSAELRFLDDHHVVRLEARAKNAEGRGEVTIRNLVVNALRMRPDRILVGECRGAEALDMIQAMCTGHEGSLTTLHANSSQEVVSRLTTMVRYESNLPVESIESYVAMALDVVVQTARDLNGRRYVSEVAIFSFEQEKRQCVVEQVYRRPSSTEAGVWLSVPSWVDSLPQRWMVSAKEVEAWKQSVLSR